MQLIKSVLFWLTFYVTLQECYSYIVFGVTGNIYPDGYYHVTMNLGNPPNSYILQIDTDSSLTWIQCEPCVKCLPTLHPAYNATTAELVSCKNPLCGAVHLSETHNCDSLDDRCNYEVNFLGGGSSFGELIKDSFPLQDENGTISKPLLTIGCGYDQEYKETNNRPTNIDGILGLGWGKEGILSQLQEIGVARNRVGYCFSSLGDGYIFLGEGLAPEGTVWMDIQPTDTPKHFYVGVGELNLEATSLTKGLDIFFDSGTIYTYFIPEAYDALVSALKNDVKLQVDNATDENFSLCWKGSKPFQSIADVKDLFKSLVVSFRDPIDAWFEIDPSGFLIINEHGSACLGIMNSADISEDSINIIGAISFQDQIIIYDHDSQKIGFVPADCKFTQ